MALTGEADVTAANRLHPYRSDFLALFQRKEIHGIGVIAFGRFFGEDNLSGQGRENLTDDPVSTVAHTGLA